MKPDWECEGVKLYCGDCLKILPYLPTVDTVITDPPFSDRTHRDHDASAKGHQGRGFDGTNRKNLGYSFWEKETIHQAVFQWSSICYGWIVVLTDHTLAPVFLEEMEKCGRYSFAPLPFYSPGRSCRLSGDGPCSWTDWIVVSRTKGQAKWGTLPGGYHLKPEREKFQMGGKPLSLMKSLVRDYSSQGQTVLDSCMGSGTTGVASVHLHRSFIGIELDPTRFELAVERISKAKNLPSGTSRKGLIR